MKTTTIIFGCTVRARGAHRRPLHQGPCKASYASASHGTPTFGEMVHATEICVLYHTSVLVCLPASLPAPPLSGTFLQGFTLPLKDDQNFIPQVLRKSLFSIKVACIPKPHPT